VAPSIRRLDRAGFQFARCQREACEAYIKSQAHEGLQTQAATDGEREARLVYYAFDLLHLDGRDVSGLPLIERKALLQLLTRTGLDWTAKYPSALAALANLNVKTAYIDGAKLGNPASSTPQSSHGHCQSARPFDSHQV
jgi:hypothetical protein